MRVFDYVVNLHVPANWFFGVRCPLVSVCDQVTFVVKIATFTSIYRGYDDIMQVICVRVPPRYKKDHPKYIFDIKGHCTYMQAQSIRNDTQSITSPQSLAAIQTLLRAGLGCITFLRNLLPDENFTESYFTAASDADTSPDSSMSTTGHGQRRNVSGFKIMTMSRGYTEEADRILNYLEHGIFDALQKQYLRSFIFAIYLDSKDPNNIVEAYTFNFRYHNLPGTDTIVPILSLGDDLQGVSLKNRQNEDPITEAVMKGKTPTLREVKKSVKSLLKTLIHAMTQMDVLPKRRFATFKLFYTDKAPLDYEPMHFQAGDAEKDKWYFMTHNLDEVPDRWSIGRVNTGHHTVNLSVTSIATYLPSSTRLDDAAFGGVTSQLGPAMSLTPEQEASIRGQQAEEQLNDAHDRAVAWSGEDSVEAVDMDADGEEDPEYVRLPDGSFEKNLSNTDVITPVGVKNNDGIVEPLQMDVDRNEACFGGVAEVVPSKLAELADQQTMCEVEQTQSMESAIIASPPNEFSKQHSTPDAQPCGISSGLVHLTGTTVISFSPEFCAAHSIGLKCASDATMSPPAAEWDNTSPDHNIQIILGTGAVVDKGLDCECGITTEDGCCFCDGGCGRWYHLWCMGYHSVKDTRIPVKFICFDCRLRADLSWELVKIDLYPKIMSKFRELALFRRAIKVAELRKPTTLMEFNSFFGSDHGLARQLFKRLESEGFMFDRLTVVDDFGLTEAQTKNTRNRTKPKKKVTKRKAVQKPTFVFNRTSKVSQAYLDYFNPDPEVESRLMGLSELKTSSATYNIHNTNVAVRTRSSAMCIDIASQTQEETQLVALASLTLGEQRDQDASRPRKKVKISVATGVDLAE
ncbi:hypothetical protein AX15_006330 [Amanita polypyramis BW_CC]|nr:hypothetical protein AX15_006330 [Amanita polypyramis BW_CC]